jgi:hypothetical protein
MIFGDPQVESALRRVSPADTIGDCRAPNDRRAAARSAWSSRAAPVSLARLALDQGCRIDCHRRGTIRDAVSNVHCRKGHLLD